MSYDAIRARAYARSMVGFRETPDGSNCQWLSDWQYGVRCPGGGWCLSFLSRCTVEGGYDFDGATHGDKGFSFTGAAEAWARQRGLWRDKNWRAAPGDWIIFNWDGGQTDHGEMVDTDDGYWIICVGGNTSNAVKYRKRDRKYAVGFVAFSQSSQAGPPPPPPQPKSKERDMVILPGVGVPAGRRRVADLEPGGLFVRLWNGGNVKGMDRPRAGDDPDMRRWYPKNADGSPAATATLPLDGLDLTPNREWLVAKRKDGSTYDGATVE